MLFNIIFIGSIVMMVVLFPYVILMALWDYSPYAPLPWLFHDKLGMHKPDYSQPGFLYTTRDREIIHVEHCKICGRRIIEDDRYGIWIEEKGLING